MYTYTYPCSSTYIDCGNTLKLKMLLPYILHDTKRYWGKSDFTYSHNRHVKTHGMQDTECRVKSTIDYTLLHKGSRQCTREIDNTIYSTTKKGELRVQNLNIRHDQTQTITLTLKYGLSSYHIFFCYFRHTFSCIYVIVNDCLPSLRHISYIYVQTK